MSWLLIAVFINPVGGGISVQQIPMRSEALCAQSIKAIDAGIFVKTEPGKMPILAGATCIQRDK